MKTPRFAARLGGTISMLVVAQVLLLFLFVQMELVAQVKGVWEETAPMQTPRQEVGVAQLEGKVYVLGGLTAGFISTASTEIYTVQHDSWEPGPSLPLSLHHVAAAAIGEKIFSIGGFVGNGFSPSGRVFELDPVLEQWLERAPLPTARGAPAAGVIDGKIYVVGGDAFNGAVSTLEVFDSGAGQWQTLPGMPTAREHLAAAVVDKKLYAIGGRRAGRNVSAMEVFDPGTNQWDVRADLPTARSGLAAAAVAGRIFVFGGEIPGIFSENEMYDPQTDTWTTLEPMPIPRHGIGAAVIANRIFLPGGGLIAGLRPTGRSDFFSVLDRILNFPQFADGQGLSSQVLVFAGESDSIFLLEWKDDEGKPFPLNIESVPANAAPLTRISTRLEAGSLRTFRTLGLGELVVGSARVFSENRLSGVVVFGGSNGLAGVTSSPVLERGFKSPVQTVAGADGGWLIDTGVAVMNLEEEPVVLALKLLDSDGLEVSITSMSLPPSGHAARFVSRIEGWTPLIDFSSFLGTLSVQSDGQISAVALEIRPNQLATLPVVPN